jgi:hypothetical protein
MAPRSPTNRHSTQGKARTMKSRTLFAAFAIAQTRNAEQPVLSPLQATPGPVDDTTLINALRNSATDRDQIIQRRIGIITETP